MHSTIITLAAVATLSACTSLSPYAGQEAQSITSLSPREVSDLLDGKGMGFAKAAELNGYPGPLHVLELAGPLELTPAQRSATEQLFSRMQEAAKARGAMLVDAERALDMLFRSGKAQAETLGRQLDAIAQARARVRQSHLEAHLEQMRILTATQVERYNRLRGYGSHHTHAAGHH